MGLQHFQQAMPTPQGLYDRSAEHDACGVAWVATLTGIPSHSIVEQAITALENLELKRHGFVFVGPTTLYAGMQANGLVDDHLVGCFRRGPSPA